ncbi:hypothetical protein QJS10_CPB12g00482 [Acorus calamus]|uniref:Uncharacterized protein n=1 Tax=Acorus calamus TaxID=4465 RepID=A0AAV9DP23_ACOCL|nr:hypothetical protein QJS10_CPB12g00482 [Acorus calamus]
MLGTMVQLNRGHGEDHRFYAPVKSRRSNYHHHQNQSSTSVSKDKDAVLDNAEAEVATVTSNLDRFLESTTPSVPAQYFSKTTMRGRRTCDMEFQAYYCLGDLWEEFREWSAYGVGVPLVLNGSDCVVQYYVPYLSGIQLYSESTRPPAASSRRPGEDSDGDSCKDSSSDGNSDFEVEQAMKYSMDQWNQHSQPSSLPSRMDGLSLREKQTEFQEGFSSDDGEVETSQGCLLFEFLERDLPYCREPLADKIADLACQFPELRTIRSCDLLPSSWISVAWYPIYRIPTGPTLKDLDACFLTFHSLATPMIGSGTSQGPIITYPDGADGVPKISLSVFGLASYKLTGPLWTPCGGSERQLANSLFQAADNWLRLRQVDHPDYRFFTSHGASRR